MTQSNSETLACTLDGNCVSVAYHDEWEPPAESHQIKMGEDMDWIDVSSVYERDDSIKETTNPKSHTTHTPNSKNVESISSSQRFSGNLKPGIIGLPGKITNTNYVGQSARRPKKVKTGGGGKKQAVVEAEPSSPKVSCIGKVLSERERARRKLREKRPKEKKSVKSKEDEDRTSCWSRIFSRERKRRERDQKASSLEAREKDGDEKERNIPGRKKEDTPVVVVVEEAEPPGIGGMKRFVSGRKVNWDFEVVTDERNSQVGETKEREN